MLLLIPNSLKCRYVPILKRGITFKLYDHSPAILEYEIRIKNNGSYLFELLFETSVCTYLYTKRSRSKTPQVKPKVGFMNDE